MKISRDDVWITAQTIWGESRGEPLSGQYAVAHVILNRSTQKNLSPATICLERFQFSVWNLDDPNRWKLDRLTLEDDSFYKCFEIALKVLAGKHQDTTFGSRHYHHYAMDPYPFWARGHTPVKRIGAHVFYNDVR